METKTALLSKAGDDSSISFLYRSVTPSLPPVIFTLLTLGLSLTLIPERYVSGKNEECPFCFETDGFVHVDIVTLCTENVDRLQVVN